MLLVLPATSTIRPTSHLIPQPYDYHPSQGYRHHHDAPRFVVPSYPAPELDFFHRPSTEELEEREYRRALGVVANHHCRQAEEGAAIRRQQLAEAARQQYFAALAAELEQQRQEELLAARRAEFIRLRQARAHLVASERVNALNAVLQRVKGAQPVRHVHTLIVYSNLITSPQNTHQLHVVKPKPLADVLEQRLATEFDSDITEPIQNILSSLKLRPVQLEGPKDSGGDAASLVENLLSSIFPDLVIHAQPQPNLSAGGIETSVSNKGKGEVHTVEVKEPQKSVPKSESAGERFADILRQAMGVSKSTAAPRSRDEAGPSGSSPPSSSSTRPAVTEREQVQIDRAVALSSVEHIQDTLTKLQTDFVLPTELDLYTPSTDDRDETASVSSASSSNLAKLIPYTCANKSVYEYENNLNGLLEELDRVDSQGDVKVREKRKMVVKAVEKALEGVEHVVGETVEKRLSLISSTTSATEEPLKGSDADEDATEEVAPAKEQVGTPTATDNVKVPDSAQAEETVADPVEGALPESDTPVEASTMTITPASAELTSATEPDPTASRVRVDAPETVDAVPSPERASPPSPNPEEIDKIDNDTDEGVLVLDSDAEKSDWSELEH